MEERLIKIRAKTGAKNEHVREIAPDHLEIAVREKPEQNAANKRILELIAHHLKLPLPRIRILKGHHKPSKIVKIS